MDENKSDKLYNVKKLYNSYVKWRERAPSRRPEARVLEADRRMPKKLISLLSSCLL